MYRDYNVNHLSEFLNNKVRKLCSEKNMRCHIWQKCVEFEMVGLRLILDKLPGKDCIEEDVNRKKAHL